MLRKNLHFLLPSAAFLFWLCDLGNIEAIRQGTEGFYLQVSKEVFQFKSWLVPMYLKQPHWSKPPFHFWLPQPFFIITGSSSLFLSRLSILTTTFLLTFLIDLWSVKHLKFKRFLLFFVLLSSVGFLKYGRIYMMEMPLSLLTAYGALLFFQFLETNKARDLIFAVLITAMANLVKGPVSFVMNFGGVFIYLGYEYFQNKRLSIMPYTMWIIGSLTIGSLWYLICYLKYGFEFIDYFFLRENLGKFQSKSYPISSVINGLLIFSLPWTLFAPLLVNKKLFIEFWNTKINRFLFFHFIFFFVLWMIPSQRSHHYAMPAQPFFLMILTIVITYYKKTIKKRWLNLCQKSIVSLYLFFTFLLSLSLVFSEIRSDGISLLRLLIGVIVNAYSIHFIRKNINDIQKIAIFSFISFSYIWIFFAPVYYLPTIPTAIINQVKNHQVSVIFNKPYFLSELLGKDVRVLNSSLIQADKSAPKNYYIMSQEMFEKHNFKDFLAIQSFWPIWRRGNKLKNIAHAFSQNSLKSLQQNMVLLIPLK
jgi:4-amino-4-deoxy-L-arabinose transferase-like glycosyltransferase